MDNEDNIKNKDRILVSSNRPIALLVGVAGFVGGSTASKLLSKGIQVIGIDSLDEKLPDNLKELVKNREFHFINISISETASNLQISRIIDNLPRVDYAIFAAFSSHPKELYSKGLQNFLDLFKEGRGDKEEVRKKGRSTKIVFISSISLYKSDLETHEEELKEGEVRFAKIIKYYKLNGRIIRLATIFGPGMMFDENDPLVRLLQSSLNDDLPNEQVVLDFSTRALFIDDAAELIIKSLLVGSTSGKIYDGALLQPIKISEIKQILLDPVWHETKNFAPTELPPWPTPNLEKTMKELSWKPKTNIIEALKKTIAYFKENNIMVPKITPSEWQREIRGWSFYTQDPKSSLGDAEKEEFPEKKDDGEKVRKGESKKGIGFKKLPLIILTVLLLIGFLLPVVEFLVGGVVIKNSLRNSSSALEDGNFKRANEQIANAKAALWEMKHILSAFILVKRMGFLPNQISLMDNLIRTAEEGIDGVSLSISGTESLFKTTRIISGDERGDPAPLYLRAQIDLSRASQKINYLRSKLSDEAYLSGFPPFVKYKISDFLVKLEFYSNLVEKARTASFVLPRLTAVEGKKSYLILLQNNLELRPAGGFIGSFGKFDFEKGRLISIKVDDIYNLDGNLKEVIEPPEEIKSDLGQNRLFLRDSNFEPDFPTSARTAQVFFRKEAGENVAGVFALDLTGAGKLLDSVGGLDLPDYGEHVSGDNLFERSISHAEVNFFPGSLAKKNYLTSLQSQLFNKIFYLSKQNWPSIISSLGDSLEQKHLLIYLSDPEIFSYLAAENWSGVMPRGVDGQEDEAHDFIATVESNMGANKANFYLDRSFKLETTIGKEGQINHKLIVGYKNNSPSDVFPAGVYKNRFKIYLPLGAKINKAFFGETEITSEFSPFLDYGRSGFSTLLSLSPREQKGLIIEYSLKKPLVFKDNKSLYRLDVIKQSGTDRDRFDLKITYPINFKVDAKTTVLSSNTQEINFSTDLLKDRSFEIMLSR